MQLFLSNPAGLWGLLGIPAVLAIHFLQTQARRVRVSTLFLLEELDKESLGGTRFERLRNSVPLWLQLLAVLLLTWLLTQPRWIREDQSQSVVVLLDASISMEAFRNDLGPQLSPVLRRLAGAASRTDWTVLDTDPVQKTLYVGPEVEGALLAIAAWRPRLPVHDFSKAFTLARALPRENGVVLFVTDRPVLVPEGITLFAIGKPIENAGFAGLNATREGWEATIVNYGSEPARRNWKIIGPGGAVMKQDQVEIQPNQTLTVAGDFAANSLRLELDPDAFPVDDVLPVVKPVEKQLRVRAAAGVPLYEDLLKKGGSLVPIADASEAVDLILALYDPLSPKPIPANAIISVKEPQPTGKIEEGIIVSERDPLTEDLLSWQGLVIRDSLQLPKKDGDQVLLWQGTRPLVFLRRLQVGEGEKARTLRQLILNFDIEQSNARRIPAFIVLVHRFLEDIRRNTPGLEVGNFESNQLVPVTTNPDGGTPVWRVEPVVALEQPVSRELKPAETKSLRAPIEPALLELRQGDQVLLQGASHFADVREANFSDAGTVDKASGLAAHLTERHSEEDFLAPVWALLLMGAMLLNYAWLGRKK